MFIKYQHLERYGTVETEGIEFGITYVFPKLDGTNASTWINQGTKAGSRNRELSLDNDNAGFYNWVISQDNIFKLMTDKGVRLYGEWLVKHTIKTYEDDAWRKFYVFDVVNEDTGEYLTYDEYQPLLEEYNVDYIPAIAKIENGNLESYVKELEKATFLVKDGEGSGEGIVIKNYDYVNKYGRKTWAKIVSNEFKSNFHKVMGAQEITVVEHVELSIVDMFCTEAFIEKEYQKLCNLDEGWSSKMIPRLLETVYHEFLKEEIYNIIKKFKSPIIDFAKLRKYVTNKIKQTKRELF